jgi:hypothetical protein
MRTFSPCSLIGSPQLTGFRETSYNAARRQLVVEGDELVSKVNGKRYGIGTLEVATLG